MWRINREAVLLGAGPAALLLQVAHPLVAEGVAQHSDFRADPFGRLRRTLDTTMALVFGDGPTAERAIRRLNGVHATVRGDVTDPETASRVSGVDGYRALDPELLLWVQATLVVTSVRAYRRWVGPVTDIEADALWQEARAVGVRMGIPLPVSPRRLAALMAWWDRMLAPDGPIQVTDTARRMAPMLLRPPLPLAPGWAVDLLALPGLGLLPDRIRDGVRHRVGTPRRAATVPGPRPVRPRLDHLVPGRLARHAPGSRCATTSPHADRGPGPLPYG